MALVRAEVRQALTTLIPVTSYASFSAFARAVRASSTFAELEKENWLEWSPLHKLQQRSFNSERQRKINDFLALISTMRLLDAIDILASEAQQVGMGPRTTRY